MIVFESNINIRASKKIKELLEEKAKYFKVTKSQLVRIALEFVTEDDVLEYKIRNHGYKQPK